MNNEATDTLTFEVPVTRGGGSMASTVVEFYDGTRYVRTVRNYVDGFGKPATSELIPATVEALTALCKASSQAVLASMFEAFRKSRLERGLPADDRKALQDAVRQLPRWAQALLPAEELAAQGISVYGLQVQALATPEPQTAG